MKLINWIWQRTQRMVGGPLCNVHDLFVGPGIHGLNLVVWVNIYEVTNSGVTHILENPPEKLQTGNVTDLKAAANWKLCQVENLDPAIGAALRCYLKGCGY